MEWFLVAIATLTVSPVAWLYVFRLPRLRTAAINEARPFFRTHAAASTARVLALLFLPSAVLAGIWFGESIPTTIAWCAAWDIANVAAWMIVMWRGTNALIDRPSAA